jgi:hypothetical protein
MTIDAGESPSVSLRHAIATLAYRAAKTLRSAPDGFAHFRAAPTTRTAVEIVAHMADLLEWAARRADGDADWRVAQPGDWNQEINRFFVAAKALDDRLATGTPIACSPERLFQGPLADALTHVGQLATLRRLAGSGVGGESYFQAEIIPGRVGMDQASPKREFD